jgi:hypothetical protein
MRPTEHRATTQRLHLPHQAQPALPAAAWHPASLLVGAGGDPSARRLLDDRPHLRLLHCYGAAAGRSSVVLWRCSDALDEEAPARRSESEQVSGVGEGAGDDDRRHVRSLSGSPEPQPHVYLSTYGLDLIHKCSVH